MSLLLFFPFTAAIHHLVFYPQQCMLNAFGPRYDLATLASWITYDPSPRIGLVLAVVAFAAGLRFPRLRVWGLALLIATLPLCLWLWDLPIGDRPICAWGHDNRMPVSTRYLYVAALAAWPAIALWLERSGRKRSA
ncbi:MAG: hypothetical protein AB7F99_13645 [Vicinamibacterales bacterium]